MPSPKWQFWIDRGGTFTDIVAKHPNGNLITHKLLSENLEQYTDAAMQGIRNILKLAPDASIPAGEIDAIKMGTTVGTNALLERRGERTVLLITQGFRDALRIGYQNRPDIFALDIKLPEMLYEQVIEVTGRYTAKGKELVPVDLVSARAELEKAYKTGIQSAAIVLMHAHRYPEHELQVAKLAREIGFTQVSVSHQVSPLIKMVRRGETTVVDAYLSPVLQKYIDSIMQTLDKAEGTRLMFMQSNGGLTYASSFRGKDCILSGPAGGIVGAVATTRMAGFDKIISFDMGGTSTDVAHYNGEYERTFETDIAGIHLRAPMMHIHTVAAGGGSVLHFDNGRFRVGPDSAGANPGPACYRRGGTLAVTDCNVMLGKIQPDYFPNLFGKNADLPIDKKTVFEKFTELTDRINSDTGTEQSPEKVAEGFLNVAIENMANAIKKISIQRGYDVKEYTLCCFGGAGAQHACMVADALGIKSIFIHPLAGVLSAYGMGLADHRLIRERSFEKVLDKKNTKEMETVLESLENECRGKMKNQNIPPENIQTLSHVHLRYDGTDTALIIGFAEYESMCNDFREMHMQRFGFVMEDKELIVEAVSVEAIGKTEAQMEKEPIMDGGAKPSTETATVSMYSHGKFHDTKLYMRNQLNHSTNIKGPAIIIEDTSTVIIEPGWETSVNAQNNLILTRVEKTQAGIIAKTLIDPDPMMLEIFNNRFVSIAEQMGYTLQNTAYSVNIKERLDFSCAIFDNNGDLIANAPHIPVHLGSMGESVKSIIQTFSDSMHQADVYMLNSPYHGGTHLPDITVITPVFIEGIVQFYVASRGHHADIGGITPGSMPPKSKTIYEEGVFTPGFRLVEKGHFREMELTKWLLSSDYPSRNPDQNIADLRAQVAANEKGVQELNKLAAIYFLDTVQAYMGHVMDNAEDAVRKVIDVLKDGSFQCKLDNGSVIFVNITINRMNRNACIDFTGTSPQQDNNFNAPEAVCKAAVLYVFRTLVKDDIPLNAGCLRPLDIIIPKGSMLNPRLPAAVVAGNVETSQHIVDALYGALGVLAASQGTMNNFTFGNEQWQYYETICGGAGAGPGFGGTDAVHTHMTNSRITDPEVLEWRFPVLLESFAIRKGSGGGGRHHGGNGVIRKIRFLEPMTAAILSSHRKIPPFGLEGGSDGKCGINQVKRKNGTVVEVAGQDEMRMEADDMFIIKTPGGGGYGCRKNTEL